MGQRANFVVINNGQWKLYYDHWIANRLENEPFWGPEYATQLIESMHLQEDKFDWLDETWCEGGAVLDLDSKILVWFGGEDIVYDIFLRKSYLTLMESNWPDWHIWWASEGIADLGNYVNIDSKSFLSKYTPDIEQRFRISDEFPEDNMFLYSLEKSNEIKLAKINGDEESLELGSSQLDYLLSIEMHDLVDFQGQSPVAGLHLIPEQNKMYYWTCQPTVDLSKRINKVWPEWKCINIVGEVEKHFELVGNRVHGINSVNTNAHIEILLNNLNRSCHYDKSNPARENLSQLGKDATISPWTDCNVQSLGSREDKLEFLNQLSEKLIS